MGREAKRVAIVYRNLTSLSGTPNTIFSHAHYLAGLGYGVDLVAERVDRSRVEHEGIRIARIPRLPLLRRRRLSWFARRAARRLRAGYDFVAGHGHCAVHDVLSPHTCERLCSLKVRGAEPARNDPAAAFQDRILTEQRFKLCIANSKLMRDELIGRYGVPADWIRVVYPGYDTTRFNAAARERHRDEMRGRLGAGPELCLIGLITSGAFDVRGLDLAIDALAALPAALRARSRMIVVGRASSVARYEAQIAAHGLEERIRIMPPTRAIERCYHALDIHIHPARFETFGQAVQEAMACGLPVITNRQVGAAELLPEEAYAELPETPAVADLAARLERLICDEDERRRWAGYGLLAVAGNSLRANCERTLRVYREAGL